MLRSWRGMPAQEVDELIAMMQLASQTSATILNSVLSLAAIESGQLRLHVAPTSLRSTLAQVVFQLRPWTESMRAVVELRVDPRLPQLLLCDGPRISQCLTNLATNALKHAPAETGRVVIKLSVVGQRIDDAAAATTAAASTAAASSALSDVTAAASISGGEAAPIRVRCEVTDNGPGIDEAQQALLFRPFVQLHPHGRSSHSSSTSQGGGRRSRSTSTRGSSLARERRHRSRSGGIGRPEANGVADGAEAASTGTDRLASAAATISGASSSAASRTAEVPLASSGLGLSITKQLVELHGGVIGVDSASGRGSAFWFEIPLKPVEVAPPVAAPPATEAAAAAALAVPHDHEDGNLAISGRTEAATTTVSRGEALLVTSEAALSLGDGAEDAPSDSTSPLALRHTIAQEALECKAKPLDGHDASGNAARTPLLVQRAPVSAESSRVRAPLAGSGFAAPLDNRSAADSSSSGGSITQHSSACGSPVVAADGCSPRASSAADLDGLSSLKSLSPSSSARSKSPTRCAFRAHDGLTPSAAADDDIGRQLAHAAAATSAITDATSSTHAVRSQADVTADATAPASAGSGPQRLLHVLVCDDAVSNRRLLCRLMQRSYHRQCAIDKAGDGAEALAMIKAAYVGTRASIAVLTAPRQPSTTSQQGSSQQSPVQSMLQSATSHIAQPYDLLLLDGHMPVLSGYQAAQEIRQFEAAARANLSLSPRLQRHRLAIIGVTGMCGVMRGR